MSNSSISITKVLFPSERRNRVLNFLLKNFSKQLIIAHFAPPSFVVAEAALDDEGLISRRAHTHQPAQAATNISFTELTSLLHLLQDKETLEMQHRVAERELTELREKITMTSRTLGNATGSLAAQEAQMSQLRGKHQQQYYSLETYSRGFKTLTRSISQNEFRVSVF
jgi:chromosome segregation ATPase